MLNITPNFEATMLETIKEMIAKNVSTMDIDGVDGFFVTSEEDQEDGIVLGAKEFKGNKYFLCQKEE